MWEAFICCQVLLLSYQIFEQSLFIPHSQSQKQYCCPNNIFCQSQTIVIVFLQACPKYRLSVHRQDKMQQLELSQNARKLIMSCPFSDVGCPFMIASIINFFCDIAVGSWKHSSTSRNSFTSTSLLTLSDQLQDLSLMSLGLEILRQSDTVSKPSAMLLPLSEMPCLEASGKVIPFSPSKLL